MMNSQKSFGWRVRPAFWSALGAVALGLALNLSSLAQAPATNNSVPLTPATFESQPWLLGPGTALATDAGTPVLSVKGGQGGRGGPGAKLIGHVAYAKNISLKEGLIEFEMKSAQLNPVGHNYIGVAFRVQDALRYEVLYLRFCPGQLAGIQYAVVSDGTDPWQQFQKPEYVRRGVFPDKTWLKVRLEIRGDRLLAYLGTEPKPVLDVPRLLGGYGAGSVGFWAFPSSGEGQFRHLRTQAGPLPGPEPPSGELCPLPAPSTTSDTPAAQSPNRRNARGGTAAQAAPVTLPLPAEPGTLKRSDWSARQMQGQATKWEAAELPAGAITNGVLQVAGRTDVRRWQVVCQAAPLKGDFALTARFKGDSRIGLVCADNQRGFIGIQGAGSQPNELRIRRTGQKIEFTLNGSPATYNKSVATEDMPFYFGVVLDSGMQCQLTDFKLESP